VRRTNPSLLRDDFSLIELLEDRPEPMKTTLISAAIFLSLTAAHSQAIVGTNLLASSQADVATLADASGALSLASGQPSPQAADATQAQIPPQQTKRILWILPNFRSVSADTKVPPQSVGDKFKTGFQDSFDYSSFVFVGIQAGIAQATDSYPAFRQGAAGYGRYYWHTFADQADENLWAESIIPSILHEDSRYYTLGHGGPLKRAGYALSRAAITRSDSGNETLNVGEIVGAGAAAGISSAYYPGQYRTWTKVGQRWLTNIVLDTVTFAVKEFWPDINNGIFHSNN
jgi:hypothetical protein